MNRRFHIITNAATISVVEEMHQKIKCQDVSEYILWITDENMQQEIDKACLLNTEFYTAQHFRNSAKRDDVVCWLHDKENFAIGTFETVNEVLEKNNEIILVYGDDYFTKNVNSSYMNEYNIKPDYKFVFLTNYNYIGNSAFLRVNYLLESEKTEWLSNINNNYDILLSFRDKAEKCIHMNQVFLIDNFRLVHKVQHFVEQDFNALQNLYRNQDVIVKERGNRYILEKREHTEKVSVIVYVEHPARMAYFDNTIRLRTAYKNVEWIFCFKKNDDDTEKQELNSDTKICECESSDSLGECLKKAVDEATGDYYVFLREAVFPGQEDWIERMLDVQAVFLAGAVSPLVLNSDMTISSAGMSVGVTGIVDSVYSGMICSKLDDITYNQYYVRENSTVSSEAFAVSRQMLERVGGFDCTYECIDEVLCDLGLRIRKNGYECVYTPYACVVCEERKQHSSYFPIFYRWGKMISEDVFFTEMMYKKYFGQKTYGKVFSGRESGDVRTEAKVAILADKLESEDGQCALKSIISKIDEQSFICVMDNEPGEWIEHTLAEKLDVLVDSNLLIGTAEKVMFLKNFDCIYVQSEKYENLLMSMYDYKGDIIRSYEKLHEKEKSKIGKSYFDVQLTSCEVVPRTLLEERIDVIIPVYNGYDYLETLFNSISRTRMKYRLIIVNDCSPDERIKPFLEGIVKKEKDVKYIEHIQNKGFVQSVNDALRESDGHVAIVNTDVEVPEGWLERLMLPILLGPDIASTTPFTNSGSICSFPNFVDDNKIFMSRDVNEIDAVFREILPDYTEIPTGVGFCMGMSKYAIREIGVLDAESFGKGYGEENDWCARAIEHGYKNVHVNNLFVYHNHGGSFLPEEKQRLLKNNLKILGEKHIYYHSDVARFVKLDPYERYRLYAALKIAMSIPAKTLLYFSHNWAGGAISYLKRQKRIIIERGEKYVGIYFDEPSDSFWVEFAYESYQHIVKKISLQDVLQFINELQADEVIVSELISFPALYQFLECLTDLKKRKNMVLKALMHDFYCMCPSYTLTDSEFVFCGVPDSEKCRACAQSNKNFNTLPRDIDEWRFNWERMLNVCDEVVCFSNDSKKHLMSVYPKVKAVVLPHAVDSLAEVLSYEKQSDTLNIGIIGAINEVKGINIIKEMSKIVREEARKVRFYIIGYTSEDIQNENTVITGRYVREELPALMKKYEIDIVLIPSVWPETFSYTTQEAIMMNLPLAVFDIGAPVERVKKYQKGLIISEMTACCALEEIEKFLKKRD